MFIKVLITRFQMRGNTTIFAQFVDLVKFSGPAVKVVLENCRVGTPKNGPNPNVLFFPVFLYPTPYFEGGGGGTNFIYT